jgi:hypothetical protein
MRWHAAAAVVVVTEVGVAAVTSVAPAATSEELWVAATSAAALAEAEALLVEATSEVAAWPAGSGDTTSDVTGVLAPTTHAGRTILIRGG